MTTSRVPLTPKGYNDMQAELKRLQPELLQIAKRIAKARELGDLKENAEYHAEREKQGLVKARIDWLASSLADAQVIDVKELHHDGRVVFGSTVDVINTETEQQSTFHIVGEYEADISAGKLSILSPLARALVGHRQDDEVFVETSEGKVGYIIDRVQYIGTA